MTISKQLTEALSLHEADEKRLQSADGISVGDTVRVTPANPKAKKAAEGAQAVFLAGHVGKVKSIQSDVDEQRGKGHLAWVNFTSGPEGRRLSSGSHVNTLDLKLEKAGEVIFK
jgi:hypothetical protein